MDNDDKLLIEARMRMWIALNQLKAIRALVDQISPARRHEIHNGLTETYREWDKPGAEAKTIEQG